MSWKKLGDAVVLKENGSRKGALKVTSTTSILLDDGAEFQRMYLDRPTDVRPLTLDFDTDSAGNLVSSGDGRLWSNENSPAIACSTYSEEDRTIHFLAYVDSVPDDPFHPGAALSLDINVHPDPHNPAADRLDGDLLSSTCIPGFKIARDWPYSLRRYFKNSDGCWFITGEAKANFYVIYKDPSVVEIPAPTPGGNGYLMIMSRVRILTSAAKAAETALDPFQYIGNLKNPGGCFSDIVAFWAPDATFTTGLKGPFLLVHSLDALDFEHRRAWLGVPGAVFSSVDPSSFDAATYLYVYYVVERHDGEGTETSDLSEETPCGDDTAVGVRDRSLTAEPILVPGTPFAKAVTDGEAEYAAAAETRGIAVRRFSLLDVVNEIVLGEPTPEADWPTENRRWHNGALRGENLGFVYLWMCGGDLGPHSIHFEAYLEDAPPKAVATTVAVADPQPAVCGEQLCLYLSAIGSPEIARYNGTPDISHRSGHGIWRGAAAPAGLTIEMPDGTRRTTTFGVDFHRLHAPRSRGHALP